MFHLQFARCAVQFFPRLRFRKHNLSLDIPVSWIPMPGVFKDGKTKDFPVLQLTDTIDFLVKNDNVGRLVGGPHINMNDIQGTLLEFWRRFSKTNADHEVFAACEKGELSLSRTIPIQIHGDEGRGFKRQGIMMLSIQGAIGSGQKPFLKKHVLPTARNKRMGLNIGGSSFNSRFLFASMPKKWYNTNPVFWRAILPLNLLSFPLFVSLET